MKTPIVDPDSDSEILRASTIMLIRLSDIGFGPWLKEAVGDLMVRTLTMKVTIEELLKGKVQQPVGEPFELSVQQRGTGDFLVMDFYGLWSHVTLTEGIRLVAFCRSGSDDATILLSSEEHCERLVEARLVLPDTRAALTLEKQDLSATEILEHAANQTEQRGDIFARYVAAKTKASSLIPPAGLVKASPVSEREAPQEAQPHEDSFGAILRILEDPKTKTSARASYLTSVYESLGMMPSPPRELVLRLLQTLFTLLLLSEAEPLHNNIVEVYLPNLLRLKNPPFSYSATEVFKDRDDLRLATLTSLRQTPSSEAVSGLIRWLEAI